MIGPVDVSKLRNFHSKFLGHLQHEIDAAAVEAGEFGVAEGRRNAPFKTQHANGLTSKTKATVIRGRRGNRLILSNASRYAAAQDKGSGTHAGRGKYRIQPRKAKALRFMAGGRWIFRRAVMHPGVPATHFLWKATLAAYTAEGNQLHARLDRWARQFSQARL